MTIIQINIYNKVYKLNTDSKLNRSQLAVTHNKFNILVQVYTCYKNTDYGFKEPGC